MDHCFMIEDAQCEVHFLSLVQGVANPNET